AHVLSRRALRGVPVGDRLAVQRPGAGDPGRARVRLGVGGLHVEARVQVARQLHDHRSRAAHHLDALLAAADRGEAPAPGAGPGAGLPRAGDGPDLDVAAAGARLDRAGPAADADLSAAGGDLGPLRHVVQVHGATGPADVQVSDGLRADLDVLVVHLDILEIP